MMVNCNAAQESAMRAEPRMTPVAVRGAAVEPYDGMRRMPPTMSRRQIVSLSFCGTAIFLGWFSVN